MVFAEGRVEPIQIRSNATVNLKHYQEATFLAMAICETCKFVEKKLIDMSCAELDDSISPTEDNIIGEGMVFYSDN